MTNDDAQLSAVFRVLNIPELLQLILLEVANTEAYACGVTSLFALQRVSRSFQEAILSSSILQGSKLCLRRTNAATGRIREYDPLDWLLAQTGTWRTTWSSDWMSVNATRKITLLLNSGAETPEWMSNNDLASWRQVPSQALKSRALHIRTYRYMLGEVRHLGDCIYENNVPVGVVHDKLNDLASLEGSTSLDGCAIRESSVYKAW